MPAADLEDFLDAVAPKYAESSVRGHRLALQSFLDFCSESRILELSAFTELDFQNYEAWLRCTRLRENTIYAKMRSLKLFLVWAQRVKRTLLDARACQLPTRHAVARAVPSAKVLKRLLELPDRSTALGLRVLLVLELLYVLGLRSCECYRLNIRDLDFSRETVRILGKGHVRRNLPLSPGVLWTANRYLTEARPLLRPTLENDALLLSSWGRRLSQQMLLVIVKEYGQKIGLKLHPHLLRHCCATHLLASGMDLEMVQQFLGHAYIDTTKTYVHVSYRELEKTFFQTHPRALWKKVRA